MEERPEIVPKWARRLFSYYPAVANELGRTDFGFEDSFFLELFGSQIFRPGFEPGSGWACPGLGRA